MRSRWTTVVVSGGRTSPPFGSRAKPSIERSMSVAFSIGIGTTSIASDGARVLADQEVIESCCFWIGQKCSAREVRCNLFEHSQPFAGDTLFVLQQAGEVPTGSRQACNEARSNWVGDASENNRDGTGLWFQGSGRGR